MRLPSRLSAIAALLLLLSLLSPLPAARAADEFLAPDVAFRFSARMADPKTVEATWTIADGYYMYREQFAFKAVGAQLGAPEIPAGKFKFDATFNKTVETYRHRVTIRVPVQASNAFTLTARGQGCADKGLCYAPQDATARLSPDGKAPPAGAAYGLPAPGKAIKALPY